MKTRKKFKKISLRKETVMFISIAIVIVLGVAYAKLYNRPGLAAGWAPTLVAPVDEWVGEEMPRANYKFQDTTFQWELNPAVLPIKATGNKFDFYESGYGGCWASGAPPPSSPRPPFVPSGYVAGSNYTVSGKDLDQIADGTWCWRVGVVTPDYTYWSTPGEFIKESGRRINATIGNNLLKAPICLYGGYKMVWEKKYPNEQYIIRVIYPDKYYPNWGGWQDYKREYIYNENDSYTFDGAGGKEINYYRWSQLPKFTIKAISSGSKYQIISGDSDILGELQNKQNFYGSLPWILRYVGNPQNGWFNDATYTNPVIVLWPGAPDSYGGGDLKGIPFNTNITCQVGTTVNFVNWTKENHQLKFVDKNFTGTIAIGPGNQWNHKFDKPASDQWGQVAYGFSCPLHSSPPSGESGSIKIMP